MPIEIENIEILCKVRPIIYIYKLIISTKENQVNIRPADLISNFEALGLAEKRRVAMETVIERSRDRHLPLGEFLDKWPFLKTIEGFRLEFRSLKMAKSMDFLIARIRRKFSSTFFNL